MPSASLARGEPRSPKAWRIAPFPAAAIKDCTADAARSAELADRPTENAALGVDQDVKRALIFLGFGGPKAALSEFELLDVAEASRLQKSYDFAFREAIGPLDGDRRKIADVNDLMGCHVVSVRQALLSSEVERRPGWIKPTVPADCDVGVF